METLEILKYTIPSIIVFFTAYFIIHSFIKNEQKLKKMEMIMDNQKMITPIRLQAYERITLFLERITPDSLLMRVLKPQMNCQQFQSELLNSIRAEFEHNLSQQVYVSSRSWEAVKNAKDNTIKIINVSFSKVKPEDPAIKMSRLIIERIIELEKSPTHLAIEILKQEMATFM